MRVLVVIGTRPEAIKLAAVVEALRARPEFEPVVLATAQHRELLDQVLELFEIAPDFDLDIMEHGQSLSRITSRVLDGVSDILRDGGYAAMVVHGDTTSTFAASLAAFYQRVPVAHVEAGMRTGNPEHPFPEEIIRSMVARIARWHFAPSDECQANLLRENIEESRVYCTPGNTVIDALLEAAQMPYEFPPGEISAVLDSGKRVVLVTAHRRESWGAPMEAIFRAVHRLAETRADTRFLLATHSNPLVADAAHRILGNTGGVTIIGPQNYLPFVKLMARADLILTDSGGIQEEGPALGSPVVVLRNVTEYGELLEAGAIALAGTAEDRIVATVSALLDDESARQRMVRAGEARVHGGAAGFIAEVLAKDLTEGADVDAH